MKYNKNLLSPSHNFHEIVRRQNKCQERIKFHTVHASFQGLIALFFLGIGLSCAQKKNIVAPLIAAPSAAYAFSKSTLSILKRKKWIQESHRLKKY